MFARHYIPLVLLLSTSTLCRARVLSQSDLDDGVQPEPGDEVILRDFSKLTPQSALSQRSERGKWWLRPYKSNGDSGRVMLMTMERDMDRPESCLVPQVTYPLALSGWYEVWVATYRGPYGGGVDVRLSGDDCFMHVDPQQVAWKPKGPKPRIGVIVEMNYKPAVEMNGQNLIFQQRYGSYESFHWGFCEASLAHVRLVRLGNEQVAAFKADQSAAGRRVIAYDDDGWLKIQRVGADGLYVFNNPRGWVTMRRMGHTEELAERVKTGTAYGVIEGPTVEFEE